MIVMTELAPGIVVDPTVRFGKPIIAGTRITVQEVLGALAGGMTTEELKKEYGLTGENVQAVLRYVALFLSDEAIDVQSLQEFA